MTSLAVSPDGKYLASGASDGLVVLWDLSAGRALKSLRGHEDTVTSVSFSAEGTLLASGSLDNTVRCGSARCRALDERGTSGRAPMRASRIWDVYSGVPSSARQAHAGLLATWPTKSSPVHRHGARVCCLPSCASH